MIDINIPLNKTHVKLDIGTSNRAVNSQKWLEAENDLFVLAFEPIHEHVTTLLSGNIDNKHHIHLPLDKKYIDNGSFKVYEYAISNVQNEQQINFHETFNHEETSSLYKPNRGLGNYKTYKVNVISLKMIFDIFPWDRFDYIDYIKIDAQGSDLDVLKSAGDYLKERVVYVTAEPDGRQYQGASECNDKMITQYMTLQGFIKVTNKNTKDLTYLNQNFKHLSDIFICQV